MNSKKVNKLLLGGAILGSFLLIEQEFLGICIFLFQDHIKSTSF